MLTNKCDIACCHIFHALFQSFFSRQAIDSGWGASLSDSEYKSKFQTDFLTIIFGCAVLCLVTQSCPTFCDPMDCSLPRSSVHGDSPGKKTGVGCHALLQRIFSTQGWNPGLCIAGRFFTSWATRDALFLVDLVSNMIKSSF